MQTPPRAETHQRFRVGIDGVLESIKHGTHDPLVVQSSRQRWHADGEHLLLSMRCIAVTVFEFADEEWKRRCVSVWRPEDVGRVRAEPGTTQKSTHCC